MARRLLIGLSGLLLLTGCTSFVEGASPRPAPAASGPTTERGCPVQRAEPDRDRPRIDLAFALSQDLATVTGTETVSFTPDLATDELVFRLVPNGPDSVVRGSGLVVDAVRGDDVQDGRYEPAGAGGPGGLYVLALAGELDAGDTTEVELDFTLTLGAEGFDRFGTAEEVSWWASGAPLLAWEPGVGWSRAPFVDLLGETASSPVADTRIQVEVPDDLTVLMTGAQDEPVHVDSSAAGGRRVWTSREPVARDVSVAVGQFRTATAEVAGVEITVGVLPADSTDPQVVADAVVADLGDLTNRFGRYPYDTLTVPVLPNYGGGIEYPSSILLAGPAPVVLLHEVAHMWFYGMVGDDQFRDPWLDEAFASYAEAVQDPPTQEEIDRLVEIDAPVGASMAEYVSDRDYLQAVYGKGAAALLTARAAAGAAAFDAAVRCYIDATAWTTATPTDLARALADLPAATTVLLDAGALDPADVPD